jgi:hypothetical protein
MASAVISGAAVAVLAPALAFGQAAQNLPQTAREHHACALIMGLDPAGELYGTCIRSVDRSLAEWDNQKLVETGRNACFQQGLKPGTSGFADCVLDRGKIANPR